jgi:CRP-like cAMP-binding protein
MPVDEFVAPLLKVPLFQGLKPLQLTEIARRAQRVVYSPAAVIIAEGSLGDCAVLIVSGEALCVGTAGPMIGEPVPVGALLGEMAMLTEMQHSATIVARTAVRALRILRTEIHGQMAEDPTLADHFVATISGRLSRFATASQALCDALASDAAPHLRGAAAREAVGAGRTAGAYH